MRALLSLIIFALIVITINLMSYPADTKNAVYLFGIYTLIVSYSAVFKVTFRAFEKMNLEDFLLAQVFFYKKKKCFMNDKPVLVDINGNVWRRESEEEGISLQNALIFLNAVKSFILYGLNILKMVIVMKTSIVEKQVDALIKGGYYPNRAEFVEDAIRAFFWA